LLLSLDDDRAGVSFWDMDCELLDSTT